MAHRGAIADFGALNPKRLGLTVDALARGPLRVNGVIEGAIAIQGDAHLSTSFPVEVFHTPFAFDKLFVVTALPILGGEEERAAEALGQVSGGVSELVGGMHAQLLGTQWHAIGIALRLGMPMLVEWDSRNTTMMHTGFVDVPSIIGRIY